MLTDLQFQQYLDSNSELIPAAIDYIVDTRSSEPSRMVGTHAKNSVCSFTPSKKLGKSISLESRGPERAFFLLCEYDENVLEIWEQPPAVKIRRTDKNGRLRNTWYTPDFLILLKNGPCVIEAKSLNNAEELHKKYPTDWIKKSDSFEYLPAKTIFSEISLRYKVFVYHYNLKFKINNLDLLLRSRDAEPVTGCSNAVSEAYEQAFSWNMFDLKEFINHDNYIGLLQLIDNKQLFFDINNDLLTEPKGCTIVQNRELLSEAKKFQETCKLTNPTKVGPIDFSHFPSKKYADEALIKLKRVESGESSRSVRRYKALIKQGKKNGLTPFQALIPKRYLSGNRVLKVNHKVDECLCEYLTIDYKDKPGLSPYSGFKEYKEKAQRTHPNYDHVCWATFWSRLEKIRKSIIANGRGGNRAENAVAEPTDPKQRILKTDLPWRCAAIDHYLADIYLVYYTDNGIPWVSRPWITAMVDLYTHRVLAFALSFASPSRRSICKVIRACVREHGKLPAEIIVDRGSDFRSVYFASLMSHYEITLSLRPSANPRYGGEVEGLFGEFKKQWLTHRQGNLADYKEARSVDGKLAPKNSAVISPYNFYLEFKAFCSWREHKPRGIRSASIYDNFISGQTAYPFIGKTIENNDEFLLATAVETKFYTVDLIRGIHIGDQYFWSPKLGNLRGKKSKIEVRIDPENPHIVYALVEKQWIPCLSSFANRFSALDPVSQYCEVLTVYESKGLKRKISEEADVQLIQIIREMDMLSENNVVPIIEIEEQESSSNDNQQTIFQQIASSPIKKLTAANWK